MRNSIPGVTSIDAVGIIMYGTFTSDVLDETASHVDVCTNTSSYRLVWMLLSASRKTDGTPVKQLLGLFTDSKSPVVNPLLSDVTYIDAITEEEGVITIQDGSDVMVLQIPEQMCTHGEDSKKFQDEWKDVRDTLWSSFPTPLDWSTCDDMNCNIPLCHAMGSHKCSLSRYNNNFCIRFNEKGAERRCKSFMRMTEATGIFLNKALLSDKFPRDMFSVEYVEAYRIFDIIYPCFANAN